MKRVLIIFASLLLGANLTYADHRLELTDVRNSMEEMFSLHVETHELTPLLVKRSIHNFVDQFDIQRIYLTEKELDPFFHLQMHQTEQIIESYLMDEFPTFTTLLQLITNSIQRAGLWRQEFYEDFMKEASDLPIKIFTDRSSGYAKSIHELKAHLRSELFRLFLLENKNHDPEYWTLSRRRAACLLFEKRFSQFERGYLLALEGKEHEFATYILRALARGLDAHTSYFTPQEAYDMRSSLEKQFEGIGIGLREGLDGVEITDIVQGSPADRSGLVHPGDILIEIDGRLILGTSYQDVLMLLKGNGKKEVTLGLKRPSKKEEEQFIQVSLRREKIALDEGRVSYEIERFGSGLIGKITIPSFYESPTFSSCEIDVKEALRHMRKQGNIQGIVLDMRSNLGGFLNQAVKVASTFMTSGVVVASKYAKGQIQYLRNVDPRLYYQGPLVILTSKMSASAAEIVAQALQDYGIAVIVGDQRTYGKGSIQYQTVTDPSASSFFKVTVGKYYTVSGRSTQIEGVKADIHVPTAYSSYRIGEKYLQYALRNDEIAPIYRDTLIGVDGSTKKWFQKNYLPFLQKKESQWTQMLPVLQKNSGYRIRHNLDYQKFLQQKPVIIDLPLEEAVNIIKDMVAITDEAKADHSRS